MGEAPWIASFLDMNAEKVPGPPGRWRRVYAEGDVRTILRWADDHLRELLRLEALLNEHHPHDDSVHGPQDTVDLSVRRGGE